VKNASGSVADSPDTARFLISSQGKRWLKAAGAVFSNEESCAVDVACEVSASESYFGEGLEKYAGKDLELPFYCGTGFPF
jgi:UDP-N-acetylglucosamine/UDP-N-acetylgalactosamine diphosphorylase